MNREETIVFLEELLERWALTLKEVENRHEGMHR